ncbi:hypothetical protein J437_LFUL012782 [Ladona fulva]|uniref:MOB kinase activator-like 2 n=1 Tax=Ladona fulva TaxID=123851 RepID=A0A8K0P7E1_LADFU|nr:hypothetical protein J437_LFUL012782 [Ladona fulva]
MYVRVIKERETNELPAYWAGALTNYTTSVSKARRKEKEVCSAPGPEEPKLYLEEAVLQERKLPDVDLRLLVDLPAGLDYNEWLASHTIAFFDHINLVYGTISEFCTMSGCPDMTGPGLRTYLWFDEKGKKTKVAAPQYIDYWFMAYCSNANDFPSSFESIVKKILRLLFHVTAHLYHCHFREILLLNLHAHLNCVFAHFSLFDERFSLVDPKETEILRDLVVALRLHSPSSPASSPTPAITAGEPPCDIATGGVEGVEGEDGQPAGEDSPANVQ